MTNVISYILTQLPGIIIGVGIAILGGLFVEWRVRNWRLKPVINVIARIISVPDQWFISGSPETKHQELVISATNNGESPISLIDAGVTFENKQFFRVEKEKEDRWNVPRKLSPGDTVDFPMSLVVTMSAAHSKNTTIKNIWVCDSNQKLYYVKLKSSFKKKMNDGFQKSLNQSI